METFTADVERFGTTATGYMVPPEVLEALGKGTRPPVIEVSGYSCRAAVALYGEDFFVPLDRKNREVSGLAAALSIRPEAEVHFDRLSHSHRRECVEWSGDATRQETRERRIAKAVEMLAEGRTLR